jgi:hypothetical protein
MAFRPVYPRWVTGLVSFWGLLAVSRLIKESKYSGA